MNQRLEKQMNFIVEADKIKDIFRINHVLNGSRRENDAEHSWHLALMAVLLAEYANEPDMDLLKVVKMLLIHDVVEIDAGDAYVYDAEAKAAQHAKEIKAADRIFNLLPANQAAEYRGLWDEFDAGETAEAKFATALDRLHPMLMNYNSEGRSWKEHSITASMVKEKNAHIEKGSEQLWQFAETEIIRKAERKGYLRKD